MTVPEHMPPLGVDTPPLGVDTGGDAPPELVYVASKPAAFTLESEVNTTSIGDEPVTVVRALEPVAVESKPVRGLASAASTDETP